MIVVSIEIDASSNIVSLSCSGHAGFDNEDGGDIVCAAVSALTGYLGLTFTEVLKLPDCLTLDNGYFCLRLPKASDPQLSATIKAITQGWLLAIRALEENYSGWVKLEYK